MADNRDVLMDAADSLAKELNYTTRNNQNKYVSYNELKKIQQYCTRHSSEPDAWANLCKLLRHRDPRSRNDWECMSDVLTDNDRNNNKYKKYSNDDLSLILAWAGRLLRYHRDK